jgi:O-methyltransferase domain
MAEDGEPTPTAFTPRQRDDWYYHMVAGGAKTRVLEAFIDLKVPELLGQAGTLSAAEICHRLALHPHRGWKFLHLLSMIGLLDEEGGIHGEDTARYSLSRMTKACLGEDGTQGFFFRDLLNYHRYVDALPFVDVLRGMPLPNAVRWPPPGLEEAEHLEYWMRISAEGAILALMRSDGLQGAKRILDVGGGDGTFGCLLVPEMPEAEITVFNLPASAYIARRTISTYGYTDRVSVYEGDFLKDPLPTGYDRIMFNRVLADWPADVCSMLFHKAKSALAPGGKLIINEPMADRNMDCSIAWEYRYVFYDTFGRATYKPLDVYRELLEQAGFHLVHV